jgi:hypothetical protein
MQTLAMSEGVRRFWVDDARVYWNGYKLQSCVYTDCANTQVTYGPSGEVFVQAGKDVFFTCSYAINDLFTCPKAGCSAGPRQFLSDTTTLNSVATDARYLYWSSTFDIYRCALADCGEIPQFVAVGETAQTLLVRGATAFWTTQAEPNADGTDSSALRIRSAPADGSRAAETLVTADIVYDGVGRFGAHNNQFDVDDAYVYWLDNSANLQRCPLTGCGDAPPTTLVAGGGKKFNLHVDASGLYWQEGTPENSQLLRFCTSAGCGSPGPATLTSASISNFALDSKYVYWDDLESSDVPGKSIYRMPKP